MPLFQFFYYSKYFYNKKRLVKTFVFLFYFNPNISILMSQKCNQSLKKRIYLNFKLFSVIISTFQSSSFKNNGTFLDRIKKRKEKKGENKKSRHTIRSWFSMKTLPFPGYEGKEIRRIYSVRM